MATTDSSTPTTTPAPGMSKIDDLYTRARPLNGWIGGGYARKASGYATGAIYLSAADAEKEKNPGGLYLVMRLTDVMGGDTAGIRLAAFDALEFDGGLPRPEVDALRREAEKRGWIR